MTKTEYDRAVANAHDKGEREGQEAMKAHITSAERDATPRVREMISLMDALGARGWREDTVMRLAEEVAKRPDRAVTENVGMVVTAWKDAHDRAVTERADARRFATRLVEKVRQVQGHIEAGGANEHLTAATVLCSEIIAEDEWGVA